MECKEYAVMEEQHRQLLCAWKLPIMAARLLLTLSLSIQLSARPLFCYSTPVALYACKGHWERMLNKSLDQA